MLTRLCISNFTIIEYLELNLYSNMTVVTGETGAGKSIIVDALALAMGGRADSKTIRPRCTQSDICAHFDIRALPEAQSWLQAHNLEKADDQCVLRRLVNIDGRSRASINGCNMPIKSLQKLSQKLGMIYGQFMHHDMLDIEIQRALLDRYSGLDDVAKHVRALSEEWHRIKRQLALLREGGSIEQQTELLRYQIRDIEALNLNIGELGDLEEEYARRAAADELLNVSQQARQLSSDDEGSGGMQLRQAAKLVENVLSKDDKLQEAYEHLMSAIEHSNEATRDLERYGDNFDMDPQRLHELEEKLGAVNKAAKVHKTEPELLDMVLERLRQELSTIENNKNLLEDGDQQLIQLQQDYMASATTLSQGRHRFAQQLNDKVNQVLGLLEMAHSQFEVILRPYEQDHLAAGGLESITFTVSTNVGQERGPLNKVASGGELSRISLALQVAGLNDGSGNLLVFDEVDTGVGSNAAHQVGTLLAELGKDRQVLCITHLAQVAGCAQHHCVVAKEIRNEQTYASIKTLESAAHRIEEMARLISGHEITEQARAHAKELLKV